MSNKTTEALKLAEEALVGFTTSFRTHVDDVLITIREALAEPVIPEDSPANDQDWGNVDGAIAWHLIDRHADNWAEVGAMMEAWLRANVEKALAEPVNEVCQPDSNCVEADGCPTELAVLQRFWREQKAEPMQQVTRADLKAAFKEGFERAADLYAPNDGQEPYAYEVWDVQDQSFTMIYATQLKEFHWIEPENIARVLYAAPVRTKDLTKQEILKAQSTVFPDENYWENCARAAIAADRKLNGETK